MAAELAVTTLNDSGSVNVEAQQQGRLLDVASSSPSNDDSKILYSVHLKLPPEREEELLSNAEAREKWYHSFISGGERTGEGEDKDPRIHRAWSSRRLFGFYAFLTREEALALRGYEGFFCAEPSTSCPSPHLTRPTKENKNTKIREKNDIEDYIFASDEIKEQMK